jgi:hypothetical protein
MKGNTKKDLIKGQDRLKEVPRLIQEALWYFANKHIEREDIKTYLKRLHEWE